MGVINNQIRGLSVAIIKNNGRILVSPGYDKVKNQEFYRLLGGGIDFGESSLDALYREMKEELDAHLSDCKLLAAIENIFTFNGQPGHELCFVYEAEFGDKSLYEFEEFKILDSDDEGKVIWLDINEAKEGNYKIFPEGVINYL